MAAAIQATKQGGQGRPVSPVTRKKRELARAAVAPEPAQEATPVVPAPEAVASLKKPRQRKKREPEQVEALDEQSGTDDENAAPRDTVAQIIVGGGKSGEMTPPDEFIAIAMAAGIVDPNPTVRLRITPELARMFLLRTHINRKLWPGFVLWLVKQMKQGDWNPGNGEVIKFNTKGELIDGQHRLTAIWMSKLDIECDVKFNIPDNAQATIDVGRKRSIADQLHMGGEKNASNLSATVRWVYAIGLDDISYRSNTSETLRFLERNPQVRDSVNFVYQSHAIKGTISTLLGAIHFIGKYVLNEDEKADEFVEVFRRGKEFYDGNPAHRLRESNMTLQTQKGATLTQRAQMEALINVWNLFRKRKTARQFRPQSAVRIEGFTPIDIGIEPPEPIDVRAFLDLHTPMPG